MTRKTDVFFRKKAQAEPVVILTCYDYPTAQLQDSAGVDVIFVGDSVGTNVLGYSSVEEVTMEDMLHHLRAVKRGVTNAFLLVDMPYQSFSEPGQAVANARRFVAAGADGVKLEGGRTVLESVKALRRADIEVCGHLGFTPQTGGSRGRVVGKTLDEARQLISDAEALDEAGIFMLVLELVPEELSRFLTSKCSCCVIGIGSGRCLDGEVQVVNDILGITDRTFRHTKHFTNWRTHAYNAIKNYTKEVREGAFPAPDNVSHLNPDVLDSLHLKEVKER